MGKRVRPTKKTRPDASSHVIPRRGDGKDCAPPPSPLPPKEWGVRRACLAIFFLDLGLGDFLHRGRLEPAFGGNRRRGIPAGQSSRRDQCTGTGSFQLDASVCAYGQTCAHYIPSEPQPPQPPQPPHSHPTTTTRHLHSSVAFSRVACCFDVKRAAHGCTRWRRCSAAQGPPAPLVLATRADDRVDGTGGGAASQLWCGAKWSERRPTGTEDRQCSWDAAGGLRRCPRCRGQSRSVTFLPQGLSSPHRCLRTLQPKQWTPVRKFLLQKTLARKKEEEEEQRKKVVAKQLEEMLEAEMKLLNDRVRHDLPLTEAEWAAWRQWMGLVPSSSSSGRRRKKKRSKRRLPRRVRIRRCGQGFRSRSSLSGACKEYTSKYRKFYAIWLRRKRQQQHEQ